MKNHDGILNVRSEPGKGSTFEFWLPIAVGTPLPVVDDLETPFPLGNGELILVVDDESAVRSTTESVLTRYGYSTMAAADGTEAVSIYAQHGGDIRVVLTDIMMPVVDGVTLCRVLKRMNPEVSVIASTGYADEARAQELRGLNVIEMLSKPFSAGTLLTALHHAISSQPATFSIPPSRCA